MKRLILFSLLFIAPVLVIGQTISGYITNEKGENIPYATVYIDKLKMGTTANSKGFYELSLAPGHYDVSYQSMGYSPVFDKVIIAESIVKDVVLPMQYYQFPELRIMASGEDPAYSIMRKAIGMAPYYQNNIENYKAEVYLKGNLVIEKMPKIVQRRVNAQIKETASELGFEEDLSNVSVKEGDLYLMESFNEINYTAPDKYVQHVVSAKNTFPFEIENMSPMDYIQASFYQPTIADIAISPLSPQAFSYYNFKFEGATEQGRLLISKIEVIPKRKSQQLFRGYLYIVEELWCLQSVDLTNENLGGTLHIKQLFIEVDNGIWLPVSHHFTFDFSMLGIFADASYNSSVKYLKVTPNTRLQKPVQIANIVAPAVDEEVSNAASQNLTQIEEILDKGEISNREMSRLVKLMDKESKSAGTDSLANNNGIYGTTTKTVAEDAYQKDKTYWDEVRPIPLSGTERLTVQAMESATDNELMVARRDTAVKDQPSRRSSMKVSSLLFGKTWSNNSGGSLHFGGLLDPGKVGFNTVDGFNYGVGLRLKKSFPNNSHVMSINPDIGYAFSRKAIQWNVNGNFSFNGKHAASVSIMGGSTSRDINQTKGINPLVNTLTSLLLEENYLKLYVDNYVGANYYVEPAKGLTVNLSARFNKRQQMGNTTTFKIFDSEQRDYTPNRPENDWLQGSTENDLLAGHAHFDISSTITYTPKNDPSSWPTFAMKWGHGINDYAGSKKQFDLLKFQVNMSHSYNLFSSLDWQVGAGGIINRDNASFYDYSHFNTQPFPLVIDHYNDAFLLKPFYYFSTPDMYVDGYVEFTSSYLLVKYIPWISNTLCRENINLAFMAIEDRPVYTEIGYSVSEIFLFAEVGVYAGFENLQFDSFGVRFAFRFNFD